MLRSYRVMAIFAVVCGLAAAVLSVRTVQACVGQVKVLAAAGDLTANQLIVPRDLRWVTWPEGALYRDTVVNPAQAEGYVARGFIPAGTVLRQSMLEPGSAASLPGTLARLSQNGTRYFAVALPANILTTVGGRVEAGEHVDIYLTNTATPLAGDVVVLSAPAARSAGAPRGIVVAVDAPEQAALLPHLASGGRTGASLVLSLRPGKGDR